LPLTAAVSQAAEGAGKKRKKAAEPTAAGAGASGAPTVIHVFAKPLQWLTYDETAALIAECGFGGIVYAVRPAGHVVPEKVQEDLPRAVEAARKKGLKVEMITTAITSARDPFTEPLLKSAAKLGVKYYRLGSWKYDEKLGVMGSLQQHKAAVKELASLNRAWGFTAVSRITPARALAARCGIFTSSCVTSIRAGSACNTTSATRRPRAASPGRWD